jgi:hypothetical protein
MICYANVTRDSVKEKDQFDQVGKNPQKIENAKANVNIEGNKRYIAERPLQNKAIEIFYA